MSIHNDSLVEANNQIVVAGGGTLNAFAVKVTATPAAGATWTFAVRKNGVDALTCTIVNPATTCSAAGSVAFAAGDLFSARARWVGTSWGGALGMMSITSRFN